MILQLKNLTKLFDKDNGIEGVNIDINEGEFITILGPSGCGKTTTLNLIGGFLKADSGDIILEGKSILNLPPEQRPLSTVFQSYALFPHMNLIENVSYGIRFSKKVRKKKAMEIAKEYIDIVGLSGYEKSMVGNLSGGQQQRVALARAMATSPRLLLLDEPLSNLDASLRIKMREELKDLQKRFNMTMIFVTHDQEEALSLSDRIIVMDKGHVVQVDTPENIYLYPKNEYIGSFIGKSNIIKNNKGEKFLVRPENITMTLNPKGKYQIKSKLFMGQYTQYSIVQDDVFLDVNLSGKETGQFNREDRVDIEIQHEVNISI
ncbi:MAG TPA: ABC transporter ATP-binding protein [Epulopiscium sp.]|nr:ABC transporter ATP-binding protein [Candidatus Epulonipiscium sp.]